MRIILLFCFALLFSCQHAENRKHKDRLELPKLSQTYKKDHHLFLNYYFGMSVIEYEAATRYNFMSNQLFLSGEKETCNLNRYGHHHTREDIDNIDSRTLVFYEFRLDGEEFEAVMQPVFKYNRLIKIELQTLNCFTFGNHQHEFYRKKIDDTRTALIDLHSKQFGKYQVAKKNHTHDEMSVINNAGVVIERFDTNKYIFNQNTKVVTIEQKCCDFKPLVIYTHKTFYDFQHNKSSETEMKFEAELNHYATETEI